MSGDGASVLLMMIGIVVALLIGTFDRPKTAIAVAIIFSAPALLRLFVAAVAG